MEQPISSLQVAVLAPPLLEGPVTERLAGLPGITLGHGTADVVVVVGPEGMDRLQAQGAAARATPVVFLGSARPEDVLRAWELGARVFIGLADHESAWAHGLRTAVQLGGRSAALSGEPGEPWELPTERVEGFAAASVRGLTDRELECVLGSLHGCSRAVIAARLFITEDTVKSHLHAARRKLGLKGRGPHLAAWEPRLWVAAGERRISWPPEAGALKERR